MRRTRLADFLSETRQHEYELCHTFRFTTVVAAIYGSKPMRGDPAQTNTNVDSEARRPRRAAARSISSRHAGWM